MLIYMPGGAQGRKRGAASQGRRLLLPLLLAALLLLALAPVARATFHQMKVREVHTGGASGGSYVVLQMWSGGQNFVTGHPIVAYGANGTVAHTFTFSEGVNNGQSQATILVAGPGYATTFPSGPTPDATDSGLSLPSSGGAVCFTQAEPPDCVSWGNFTGTASLPSATGTPESAAGVTAGKALHRSIAPGCSSLLEPGDDTNNSATDFSEQNPNPRSNSSTITEGPCPVPPNTVIDTKPTNPTKATSASFTYHAVPASGATFECKLDGAAFSSCPVDGIDYPGPLAETSHTFQVRAKNSAGADASPASYTWTISSTAPPDTTILNKPPNPSDSSTASFTYSSSETGSTFECSLDGAPFASCSTSGVAYNGLANGGHSFQVRAVNGGLKDASPASYSWNVAVPAPVPSLPALLPIAPLLPTAVSVPQTILSGKPAAVTRDRTPTFRFRSNVVGASFRCKVDGRSFQPCSSPFTTKTLSFGPHVVQVRAVAGGAADSSPAKSSFKVAKPRKRKRGR
jgi:large repetitive protein